MQTKTFSIKGILILCLFAGATIFFLTSVSFARELIRTVMGVPEWEDSTELIQAWLK